MNTAETKPSPRDHDHANPDADARPNQTLKACEDVLDAHRVSSRARVILLAWHHGAPTWKTNVQAALFLVPPTATAAYLTQSWWFFLLYLGAVALLVVSWFRLLRTAFPGLAAYKRLYSSFLSRYTLIRYAVFSDALKRRSFSRSDCSAVREAIALTVRAEHARRRPPIVGANVFWSLVVGTALAWLAIRESLLETWGPPMLIVAGAIAVSVWLVNRIYPNYFRDHAEMELFLRWHEDETDA